VLVVRPSAPTPITTANAKSASATGGKSDAKKLTPAAPNNPTYRRYIAPSPNAKTANNGGQKPPPPVFAAVDAAVLADVVDRFSLMTYDFAPKDGVTDPMVVSNVRELLSQQLPRDQVEVCTQTQCAA